MKYKKLNNTDLMVSNLCLGTVNYGTATNDKASLEQLDYFMNQGGNFIDTGHIYGNWVTGKVSPSEKIIGEWLKSNNRSNIILSTKGCHPNMDKLNKSRVFSNIIDEDLYSSLEFLHTDYVDIYFLHRDNLEIPVSELIDKLEEKVREGLIRYYGCSNWSLSRVIEANEYARKKNYKGFVVNQIMYSLADINYFNLEDKSFVTMDNSTLDYSIKNKISIMSYMAIARGYFTKKQSKKNSEYSKALYNNKSNEEIFNYINLIKDKYKLSELDISLLYLTSNPLLCNVPIASFSSLIQLKESIESFEKTLPLKCIQKMDYLKKIVYY